MTKRETADALYHSSARANYGVKLIYHGPGADLPEHSHLGFQGHDSLQQPIGNMPKYVPLTDPGEHEQ